MRISFDQYQRYMNSKLIIDNIRRTGETFKILEVGANEHKNLEKFLPDDKITYLDIKVPEHLKQDLQYIEGDATDMQFVDDAYDFVIALDVYEHIPNDRKERFIKEIYRVSSRCFILAAPFYSMEVKSAEERVNQIYKTIYEDDYVWLKEHMENSLPSLSYTKEILKNNDIETSVFKHGDINIWERLLNIHFFAERDESLCEYRSYIDEYYNSNVFGSDYSENAYRTFIIGKKKAYNINIEKENVQKIDIMSKLDELERTFYRLYYGKGTKKVVDSLSDSIIKKPKMVTMNLFYDIGDGFNAEEVINNTVTVGQTNEYSLVLKKGIKSLRLDPIEGYWCKVSDVSVKINGLDLEAVAISKEKFITKEGTLFFTEDPMYIINIPNEISKDLEIEIKYKVDYMDLKDSFAYIIGENELILEELKVKTEELKVKTEELQTKAEEYIELKEVEETVQKELAHYKEHYQAAIYQRDALQNELQIVQTNYYNINNAFFWKITKPFRTTLDLVKNNSVIVNGKKLYYSIRFEGVKSTIKKIKKKLKKSQYKTAYEESDNNIGEVSFSSMCEYINKEKDSKVFLEEEITNYKDAKESYVLLVSHELNLTGAPMALFYFARSLKNIGKKPIIICSNDGKLRDVITNEGIPVIVMPSVYEESFVNRFKNLFCLIVANTIVSYPIINMLSESKTPVMWWIHEAQVSYKGNITHNMKDVLGENVHVYCGGEYAKSILNIFKPQYNSDLLLYTIEKSNIAKIEKMMFENKEFKYKFAIVGMQEERKGQDVLVDAISKLSREELEESLFVFVGNRCSENIYTKIKCIEAKFPESICYIEELYPYEIKKLYKTIDCLICASKDDPMPIVVTEAMMFSKIIICSENTGSASLIESMNAGLIYRNNSSDELAEKISYVLKNKNELTDLQCNARETYERYFTEEAFNHNIKQILNEICYKSGEKSFEDVISILEDYNIRIKPKDKKIVQYYCKMGRGKKVLLLSHELSLTGAPIALHYLAKYLKDRGDCPIVVSPFDGKMEEEISKDDIPIVVYEQIYESDFLKEVAEIFDLIVLNTVVTYRALFSLSGLRIPVMWWIHDSEASYKIGGFKNCLPRSLESNVSVYCAGPYAEKMLKKYYSNYDTKSYLYCVPDFSSDSSENKRVDFGLLQGKLVFTIIGMQDERKGHDILINAISMLSQELIEKSKFIFIGKKYSERIWELLRNIITIYPENILYVESFNRSEIFSIYEQSDCIICSSLDDPMPIFVTEGMLMSKVIICSESTGSADLIKKYNAGLVYGNNDYKELAEKIKYVIENYSVLEEIKLNARKCYEENFSEEVYREKTKKILNELIPISLNLNKVTVVIPTYNAGKEFAEMLDTLLAQEKIESIEIVVIDSGSVDETVDICKERKIKLIEISQNEFSHSYARNLGAEVATGNILIFMTQDAKPSSNSWVYNMIEPLENQQIAAVSCVEKCPNYITLYHKVAAWHHQNALDLVGKDRITSLEQCKTEYDWRINAALNDVACVVRKDVFDKFRYRYDYAEDLDLGCRLLKSGHKLKLLSSEYVVHGHNRSQGYYIKRGIVENTSLKKILNVQEEFVEDIVIATQIITAYKVILSLIKSLKLYIQKNEEFTSKQVVDVINEQINKCKKSKSTTMIESINLETIEDKIVSEVIKVMTPYAKDKIDSSWELVGAVQYYIENVLKKYIIENCSVIDEALVLDICDCILKQLATHVGLKLSNIRTDEQDILELIEVLKKGV